MGETGTYYIAKDDWGIYIATRKYRKFYIELKERENFDQHIEAYNKTQQRQAEHRETRIIINGNQVLVPVNLKHGQNEIETFFLLDTGASLTTLNREIADRLNIRHTQKAEFMVVGGKTITADVVKLSSLEVGPFQKKNIQVGIIDHVGPSLPHKGLLGMNILRGLEYRIDFRKQVIEWKL